MRYWKVILSLVVVAVSSGLIGAAVALHVQNRRTQAQPDLNAAGFLPVERLQSHLRLSPEQRQKLRSVLERSQTESRSIAAEALAKAARVRMQMHEQIRPYLTPEQQRKLERLAERQDRLRARVREHLLERRSSRTNGALMSTPDQPAPSKP
jgi:hypothetical protein